MADTVTRNIVDSLGQVIGKLTLPADTREETWEFQLQKYAIERPTTWIEFLHDHIDDAECDACGAHGPGEYYRTGNVVKQYIGAQE